MALATPALAGLALHVICYLVPWPPFTKEGVTVIRAKRTIRAHYVQLQGRVESPALVFSEIGAAMATGAVSGRSDHPDHVAVNPLREGIRDMLDPRLRGPVRRHHAVGATRNAYFLVTGTGMPGILTLTAPRWLRLVK
jgi:hypothetical protein